MRNLWLFVLMVCCCGANAQLLYEISGNGLSKPSYLFGTHHMVSVGITKEIPGVFRAFNDCSAVVGEFVDDNPEEMQRMILAASKMEQSILDLLDADDVTLVDSALQAEMGLSLSNVQFMRPNVIALIYEMTMSERLNVNKSNDMSIDSYFQVAAAELGKEVYGLETLDMQLDMLLRSIPIERQAEVLVETIRNSKNIKKEYEEIEKLYKEGNLDKLYELLLTAEDMTEAEKFLLVDERNRDWMPKLEEYIKKEACFVAVGALHLPGKDGLLNLLKKAGYKIKAVK